MRQRLARTGEALLGPRGLPLTSLPRLEPPAAVSRPLSVGEDLGPGVGGARLVGAVAVGVQLGLQRRRTLHGQQQCAVWVVWVVSAVAAVAAAVAVAADMMRKVVKKLQAKKASMRVM